MAENMNHTPFAISWLVFLLLAAGLAACAWALEIMHRRRGDTQVQVPIGEIVSKNFGVETLMSYQSVRLRPGAFDVVQKETPSKVVPMRGPCLHSIDCHLQHTKNAYQSSRARHGFGVRQCAVVLTNQTLRELRGCLSGEDEPRSMDKPKRLTNAGTRRGEKTRVSFNPEPKPGNSDPETWWVSIATAIRLGRTTFAG